MSPTRLVANDPLTSFAAGSLRVGGVREAHPEEMEAWLGGLGPRIVVDGGALGLDATAELGLLRAPDAPARFGYVLVPQPD